MYKAISNMKKQVKGKKRKAVAKKDALLDEWTDMAVDMLLPGVGAEAHTSKLPDDPLLLQAMLDIYRKHHNYMDTDLQKDSARAYWFDVDTDEWDIDGLKGMCNDYKEDDADNFNVVYRYVMKHASEFTGTK